MRACLECGEKLRGREDKKFCSQACRNAYHNKINKDSNNLMRTTNNQLRKNFRILKALHTSKTNQASRTQLLEAGFDFQLFTSIDQTESGTTLYFVYNLGYRSLDANHYLLIEKP